MSDTRFNKAIAFSHMRMLYAKLHNRWPTPDEVDALITWLRPDWPAEKVNGLVDDYIAEFRPTSLEPNSLTFTLG